MAFLPIDRNPNDGLFDFGYLHRWASPSGYATIEFRAHADGDMWVAHYRITFLRDDSMPDGLPQWVVSRTAQVMQDIERRGTIDTANWSGLGVPRPHFTLPYGPHVI